MFDDASFEQNLSQAVQGETNGNLWNPAKSF